MPMRHNIKRGQEDGYVLAAVVIMLAVLMISMSVAVPKVRDDIRRDRELETVNRGRQYIRAIQLYYRKFRTFPPSVDTLISTDQFRFLRKRYLDPLTGKDDWEPVFLGENRAPISMSFFGQPLNMGAAVLTSSQTGASSAIVGPSPNNSSASSSSDDSGDGTGSSAGDPGMESGIGKSAQIFGGGGIIGFSPSSPDPSILIYKTKDHYSEWEFVYDPATDHLQGWPMLPAPGPPANTGAPGLGPGANPASVK